MESGPRGPRPRHDRLYCICFHSFTITDAEGIPTFRRVIRKAGLICNEAEAAAIMLAVDLAEDGDIVVSDSQVSLAWVRRGRSKAKTDLNDRLPDTFRCCGSSLRHRWPSPERGRLAAAAAVYSTIGRLRTARLASMRVAAGRPEAAPDCRRQPRTAKARDLGFRGLSRFATAVGRKEELQKRADCRGAYRRNRCRARLGSGWRGQQTRGRRCRVGDALDQGRSGGGK